MVVSCLAIYGIVFSCFALLVGKSLATIPVQLDGAVKENSNRRGTKIHLANDVKAGGVLHPIAKVNEKPFVKSNREIKVLQNSFLPTNRSIRTFKKPNWFLASSDTANNKTEKLVFHEKILLNNLSDHELSEQYRLIKPVKKKLENKTRHKKVQHLGKDIKNFITWDTLEDSEKEVRIHYNGITAEETTITTGIDEETGKTQSLMLRQLTDGVHFIQLIYSFGNIIQDCEFIRDKTVVRKFLDTFQRNVNKAKLNYEKVHEKNQINRETAEESDDYDYENDDEEDTYLEEDEGKIERLSSEWESDYDEENSDLGMNRYRNVTFQIIRSKGDVPEELAEWMNYPILKKKCNENHKMLKSLVYNSRHGSAEAKKLANEHLERVKRGLDTFVIFPGTKWCGKSSTAEKYTDLGGFFKVDKCCRAHDHCHPLIRAFDTKFNFYNFRPFTISHCRCDLRRKRDIMDVLRVPGTKWCGKGRRATKYTSLGGFSRTDKCCRVHDTMCPHWIGSMEEKYGLFNWRINTIMHCRCDKRFRACLKMAKTGTANFVGKLFFNVVQTKCFVLKPREVCLKYSWWGKCEKKEYRRQAHLKDNLTY